MTPDDPAFREKLKLLKQSYDAIYTLEEQLTAGVVDRESRDAIIEAFRVYREAHHKVRCAVTEVVVSGGYG